MTLRSVLLFALIVVHVVYVSVPVGDVLARGFYMLAFCSLMSAYVLDWLDWWRNRAA